jgi:type I restriction enzyme S subunit
MVDRAKLSAPREAQKDWPWHYAKWGEIKTSIFWGGDRRMEAENYLSGGYGIRLAMEARTSSRGVLGEFARTWQPSRLKGILVSKEHGTPFLAATQVFDLRPVARKFLSLGHTDNIEARMVKRGDILVTRSGTVGRATLAHVAHEHILISDDLLRVTPKRESDWGWIYAFLRSPQGRAMMGASQYGHIIKHLEPSHLERLPIPIIRDNIAGDFHRKAQRILELRIKAFETASQAEQQFTACFPSLVRMSEKLGFEVRASSILNGRRRLDASSFAPISQEIERAFMKHAVRVETLEEVTERVFVPGRFKHVYGEGGLPYLDSADILEVNPDITKYVLSLSHEEQKRYHVEPGWLVIPCSGQVHGNIGHSVLATEWHTAKVLTNHLMRVVPNESIPSGYLQCILGHPELGRPRLVKFAFGSSVPEIAPADVLSVAVPRL